MLSVAFTGTIDLPKSQYYFSGRTTYWQCVFNLISIIFLSVDTAIEDIISKIARSVKEKIEEIGIILVKGMMPRVACA